MTKYYKVIVIKGYWSTSDEESEVSLPLSVLVYSLRLILGDIAENNKRYFFVNGVFYCLGSCSQYENLEVIVSFDMANDSIQEIIANQLLGSLAIYHDSIAFLTVHEIEKCFDSWTKTFTMGPLSEVRNPMGHWKTNKFLLECDSDTQDSEEYLL
ncbi:hypothetical protein D5086_033472 [Populus alba]|uniref:Uncharacterized protein n=3 Tax=Populus TaxID=3689 RepID=A0ACC4AGW7_POPAL|nr:hypothetical protein NC653_041446 [Populus alba x Populus x berolinensis]TKR84481.1 hypothetical protein D5086_0000257610 [Populus alba]